MVLSFQCYLKNNMPGKNQKTKKMLTMFTPDLVIKNSNSNPWFRGIYSVVPNRRAVTCEAHLTMGVIRRMSKLLGGDICKYPPHPPFG